MQSTAQQIAEHLNGQPEGDGWIACCTAHNDTNPSLVITERDGKVLFYCRSQNCTYSDIIKPLKAHGFTFGNGDNTKQKSATKREQLIYHTPVPNPIASKHSETRDAKFGKPSAVFKYLNAEDHVLGFMRRFETAKGKVFKPLTPWSKDSFSDVEWIAQGFPTPLPIYNASELRRFPNKPVLLVEGEKTADAARLILQEFVVITWPGGASKVSKVDWSALEGRSVTIWPDNDSAGQKAAKTALDSLKNIASSIVTVQVPKTLPEKWDLADEIPEDLDIHSLLRTAHSGGQNLIPHITSAADLRDLDIPPKTYLIEPFLPAESLSMVYAPRGIGKTWFSLALAISVANGIDFMHFHVPTARNVLYIDGEMARIDLVDRLKVLEGADTENLRLLLSETLFQENIPLNINKPEHQDLIVETLDALDKQGRRPGLIILDNLSSLGGGIDENDNSALETQLEWLRGIRHRGYAVLLVHHAGKSGEQRGASRREDLLDTCISLTKPKDEEGNRKPEGAYFQVEFVKSREKEPQPVKFIMELRTNAFDELSFTFEDARPDDPRTLMLLAVLKGKVENGTKAAFTQQKELVDVLDMSKGNVSKQLKTLRDRKLVINERSQILITPLGVDILRKSYKDLDPYCSGPTIWHGEQDNFPI